MVYLVGVSFPTRVCDYNTKARRTAFALHSAPPAHCGSFGGRWTARRSAIVVNYWNQYKAVDRVNKSKINKAIRDAPDTDELVKILKGFIKGGDKYVGIANL